MAEAERTGVSVTITTHGRPVAVLTPAQRRRRKVGQLPTLAVPENFDDSLPDSEMAAWETDMTASDLPIDASDATLACRLPWEHKDPIDRMIVAQAARRNLTIATSDTRIVSAALSPTLKA
ncbi:hypothetical protein BST20_10310 [Mycobacterium branderi]|uniref:PIN domain-containing protein n=1 Tax=Mycobacterium branderi TaxID=43348 RepID=A0A7I7W3X7_9MYCO|nr:hypothetical protein BST20_10310 [Mycobacterium branderi]BBZ12289.1 hypothetical protein MBRA_24840 [Mycobacterium branderi]